MMPGWWAAIGVGAAATAILVLIHRLRPRSTQAVVATTQFWPTAQHSDTPRMLGRRFARFGSFLIVLAVLWLLATAISGWMWATQQEPTIIVIDTGYTMAAMHDGRSRLAEATDLADADLRQLGQTSVTVISAGTTAKVVDSVETPAAILSSRLAALQPASGPSDSTAALSLAAQLLPFREGRVIWYTDRPALPPDLPAGVAERVDRRPVGVSAVNSAIVSAVFESDSIRQSGTMHVVVKTWGSPVPVLRVRMTKENSPAAEATVEPGDVATFNDILMDGKTVSLELIGDTTGVAADDRATVRLPVRNALRFHVATAIPPALQAAIASIGSITTSGEFDVYVGEKPSSVKPSICLTMSGSPVVTGQLVNTARPNGPTFESAITGAGHAIEVKDATQLLRSDEAILVALSESSPKALWLSDALFSPGETVTRRPSFFVLIERAVREMTGQKSQAAVSLPLVADAADRALPLNLTAGDLRVGDMISSSKKATLVAVWQPWEWLLLLAATAAGLEGLLYATRRIV